MADECELEFLDEDAEIVQQCVQTVEPAASKPVEVKIKIPVPVLVERRPVGRPRKKRKAEEDSDYEPFKYLPPKNKKKKTPKYVRSSTLKKYESYQQPGQEYRQYGLGPRKANKLQEVKNEKLSRKEMDIRVPDYDDPLCLPVRAIKWDETDTKRLKIWNNLCLEHFEHSDTILKPDTGETVSSKRTIILRNVTNKRTGKPETTVWSKISVENDKQENKSEVVQSILPKYREKKLLNYKLIESKRKRPYHHIDEVIITKEDQNGGERLIVYKPRETISLVYKMFEKKESSNVKEEDDDEHRPYMKEVASCRVCAPCYQMSWRGFKMNDNMMQCEICSKVCRDISSLLMHLKSHSFDDMNKYKKIVSKALAKVVEHHYKCRICQQKFPEIKQLRRHVLDHRGTEKFICDLGSHVAT